MNQSTETFEFTHRGISYLKICLDITVYWRGSAFDRVPGVLHFYERALEQIRPHLKFYETGTMSGAKPLTKDALEMVPTWFAKAKPRKDIYIMTLESGTRRNEPSDNAFYLQANEESSGPVGVARLMLPMARVEEAPDQVVQLTLDLISKLDFESGHVGYGVNWDAAGDMELEAKEKMFQLSTRFLGIDLADVDVTLVAMNRAKAPGIKCINWLTLLGKQLAATVGGPDAIRARLPQECIVYTGPSGLALRAGARPTLGDRNRTADLSAYRSVAKLLAPYRFPNHKKVFGGPSVPGSDPMADWLSRFDY